MKKNYLILPLLSFMLITIFMGCKGKDTPVINLESIDATCNKTFKVNDQIKKTDIEVIANYSDKTTKKVEDWSCNLFNNDSYTFLEQDVPEKEFVITYKEKSKKIKIKNSFIFNTCSWKNISDKCNDLENHKITDAEFCKSFVFDNRETPSALKDFIGKERIVNINNQNHKVRVIGINHDVDENDNKLLFTFEFVNLISDSNGNSLAYLWNDTDNQDLSANQNYTNSSIRYALNGTGNNNNHGTTILAAVKGGEDWNNPYKDKKIISMLPEELTTVMKNVKKTVGTTHEYKEENYTDRLFMPSILEQGYIDGEGKDKGYGKTYEYYKSATEKTDSLRVKKQVNNLEIYTTLPKITSGKGHSYLTDIYNSAGYNYSLENKYGGFNWTRSPYKSLEDNNYAYSYDYEGKASDNIVYECANGVAPAFCI